MYIKQIIIQGFRSYKDQTVIEPFSSGTNVIVGRNGSGKSNFFAAIRFVLSDAYTQMSREERQALLHEGSGSAVVSAYVEIIFDNSDDRFPTGNKEVVLRRTIGLKKDEYSVDRKVAQKSEVTNLLEAAGFSRSNPYYIVPQGRVTALTNMKESDRLNLLKEVAGTQVYEARRTESLKIMNETTMKRQKIDELLQYIKARLDELEEEKEELRGFQDKDRERRCLEYAFYHQEQVTIQEALDEIDAARQEGLGSTEENRAEFLEGERAIAGLNGNISKLQREMEMLGRDRRDLEEDRRETSKAQARAELKVKSLADGQSAQEQARAQHAAELEAVKREIAAKENDLARIAPDYAKRRAKEVEVKQALDTAEATRTRLFTKQTRNSQYKNKAERDAFLKGQIQDLNLALGDQKAHRLDADESVQNAEGSIQHLERDVASIRSKLEGWSGERKTLDDEVHRAREAVEKLDEERKLLRREDRNLDSALSYARAERDEAEKKLASVMDGPTARGLATIRRLKREQDIPGAYGTLAELINVSEAYRVAVERTADSSLFHYVVDNAETATYLANHLHKHHGGRVTFMPLDQLRAKPTNMPRAKDVFPLLSKIEYDPKFERAMQQVFGRWVVCSSLQIANQYSRSHGVNGVTPDGDITNKRGAMTGGYVDPRKSRLEAVQAVNKARDEYERLLAQSDALVSQSEKKDQEVTQAKGAQQKAEQRLRQLDDSFEPLRHELVTKTAHLERERSRLETATARRENVERAMKEFGETIAAYEAELATEFKKALTPTEERQLEQLGAQIQELHQQWSAISKQRRELEQRKQMLEVDLRQNLQLRLDQLNSQAFENVTSSSASGSLKEAQKELRRIQKSLAAVEERLRETDEKLDSLQTRIEKLEAEKARREEQQQEIATRIERQQKKIEKSLQRKALLATQATECAKNIRDLGVLPEEAFGKYEKMAANTITARLKKVNEALKKYKHVNKKAFEQYNSFTAQQEALLKRRADLDASQESIEQLVQHLDQRKDEAIERTFKQVSKEFATIFEKLVPAGHGRLVIQRRTDRRQEPVDSDDEEQRSSVENYTGVGISVSFNSKEFDEQQKIQQLSGGQKSLCALCLIFALQQTESSPMVIFDEVDANLDAQYRTAVAALLESISQDAGTQFICTTFRPEIVHVADKCYGVTFRNKTSSIDCVPTEEALNFVEGQKA